MPAAKVVGFKVSASLSIKRREFKTRKTKDSDVLRADHLRGLMGRDTAETPFFCILQMTSEDHQSLKTMK